jgi:uncharacterized damage-inducible protein DinB
LKYFFEYNWQIRDEWFDISKSISKEELYAERTGGMKSFAQTFFHIIKVEYDWICDLQEKPISEEKFNDFRDFESIIALSKKFRLEIIDFIKQWNSELENKILSIDFGGGNGIYCTYGEAMRHIIAHEIHHIGQLSIWAREVGLEPVNANFIHRGIIIDNKK